MALKRVRNIVATTQPIFAYGGIRLSEGAAEEMARQLREGHAPMTFNHDASRPLNAVVVDAGTELRDDGYRNVWLEFDIPEEEWDAVLAEVQQAGAPGGFSFRTFERIEGPEDGLVEVAGDAHHFADDEINALREPFAADYTTRSSRVYQFSFVPDAALFFTFAASVVAEVPSHLLAGMIIESCKSLTFKHKPNTFPFAVKRSNKLLTAKVRVVAEDKEAFVKAVGKVPAALKAALETE